MIDPERRAESEHLVPHLSCDGDRQIVYLGNEPIGSIHRQDRTHKWHEWHAADPTMAKTRVFKTRRQAAGWLWREFLVSIRPVKKLGAD